jgi:hypothetical protein
MATDRCKAQELVSADLESREWENCLARTVEVVRIALLEGVSDPPNDGRFHYWADLEIKNFGSMQCSRLDY